MKQIKRIGIPLIILLFLLAIPLSSAIAQTYSFSMDEQTVNVFWNADGTASIDYVFVFTNDAGASRIDYVDVGTPNSYFDDNSIYADVDGMPVSDISRSGYQGNGTGFAVGLGGQSISPGSTGRVHVFVGTVRRVLYADSQSDQYASAVFAPTYFGSQYVHGNTKVDVTFHMPTGVQPDEPRWHEAPSGFPSEPMTGIDDQGNVYYKWVNFQANGYSQYKFGCSFPLKYVPGDAIVKPTLLEMLGISSDTLIGLTFCGGFGAFILFVGVASVRGAQKRKLQYLPPKIAIEGHGIKRGLTAIEAAVVLEQPLDKIMTMILFATIKKGAATVVKSDPLELSIVDPMPEDLMAYETSFLEAFKETQTAKRRRLLQDMTIDLVKSVSNKMKGFSRRETLAYYQDIVKRAWTQVEAAQTPEVKSAKYDEVMEWTMLDKNYGERTQEVFRGGPVFVPVWWGNYSPVYRTPSTPRPAMMPSSTPISGPGMGGGALPHLPGSDFAASIVNGVQNFSSHVIGNLSSFTEGVTNKTNPVPVATSSGRSSGGHSGGGCACACACAGCACACAGGGR
jgi:hypothetical protein